MFGSNMQRALYRWYTDPLTAIWTTILAAWTAYVTVDNAIFSYLVAKRNSMMSAVRDTCTSIVLNVVLCIINSPLEVCLMWYLHLSMPEQR